jgi:CubicO group peptidase (beta-lactamase class C family)
VFVGGMSEAQFEQHRHRFGININLSGRSGDPMLIERNRHVRCVSSVAAGNSATARGLGRFYEALLAVARGADGAISPACLAEMTSPQCRGHDPMRGGECSYGYGFMVGLADHHFGRLCGPGSFGHSGYAGMSAALCDPELELVVAFHLNGRVDAETGVRYRRPALVENIYRAVAGES